MSHDEFVKLFKYMTKRFDEIDGKMDSKFDKVDQRFDRLEKLVDSIVKNQEINDDERLVMGRLLDRHDQWIHALADKIGYKLSI